jgi:hypothetical protein
MKYLISVCFVLICSLSASSGDLPPYPSNDTLYSALEAGLESLVRRASESDESAQKFGFENAEEAKSSKLGMKVRYWYLGCYGIRDYQKGTDWYPVVINRSRVVQSVTNAYGEERAIFDLSFRDDEWKVVGRASDRGGKFKDIKILIDNSGKEFDFDKMGVLEATGMDKTSFLGFFDEEKNDWFLSALTGFEDNEFEFGKTLLAPDWIGVLSKYTYRYCPKK